MVSSSVDLRWGFFVPNEDRQSVRLGYSVFSHVVGDRERWSHAEKNKETAEEWVVFEKQLQSSFLFVVGWFDACRSIPVLRSVLHIEVS